MGTKTVSQNASSFLYELNNAQHEYGFKSVDEWVLDLVTLEKKSSLESMYYPILFLQVPAEDIKEFLALIEKKLSAAVALLNSQLESKAINKDTYLVAYNPARLK